MTVDPKGQYDESAAHMFVGERSSTELMDLVNRALKGDRDAEDAMLPQILQWLRELARSRLRKESAADRMQTDSLINRLHMKMRSSEPRTMVDMDDFEHYIRWAMWCICTDEARRRKRRGEQREEIGAILEESKAMFNMTDQRMVEIESALQELEQTRPRAAQVVRHRFIRGLSVAQTAHALHTSDRTVESDWSMARDWLRAKLGDVLS